MSQLEQNIQNHFGVLQQEDLRTISSLFHLTTLKKGDLFLKSGTPCEKLSFVETGILRFFVPTEDKEVTQWISTQGFVTDLSSLLFETPGRFTVQALTDCTLYTITKDDYKKIGNLVPKWHELEKLFIAKCFVTLEDRILSHLSMSAEERYDYFFQHNKDLFNQVPLQYIASLLGMTAETFSRIRKKQL